MQKVKRTWTARRRARARLGLLAGLATVALLAATACTPPAPEPGQRYRAPADFGEGILTAALDLTGHLPPAGYTRLSGTMFKSKSAQASSNPNGESNSGSTLNQNLAPTSPTGAKGQNRKSDPQKAQIIPLPGGGL